MKFQRIVPGLLLAGLALSAAGARAEGPKFLPVTQPGFRLAPTLAVTVGAVNVPDADHDSAFAFGLDFNFNCLLFQTPENRMRTHLLATRTDKSGLESTTLELSPRYTLPLGAGVALGAGPSLAWVRADAGKGSRNLFGYGVAVGPEFRKDRLYSGIDLRYMATTERNDVEFENWALLAKVGFNF